MQKRPWEDTLLFVTVIFRLSEGSIDTSRDDEDILSASSDSSVDEEERLSRGRSGDGEDGKDITNAVVGECGTESQGGGSGGGNG